MDKQALEREIQAVIQRETQARSGRWVPGKWLTYFLENPQKAVSDALSGRYFFEHLHTQDPEFLLLDLAELVGPEFRKELNEQVLHWIHMTHVRRALLILNWVGPDGTYEQQQRKEWWLDFRKYNYMEDPLPKRQ